MGTDTVIEAQESTQKSNSSLRCSGCGELRAVPILYAPDRFHGGKEVYCLVRCTSCSLVWLDNAPSPGEMDVHYGPDYDRWVAAAGDSPERWSGRVKEIAQYKSGGSLLDLGCSSGGFLKAMRGPSWELSGIEMSESVASHAESVSGAQVFAGDILDAPYGPASFDAITCFHVFEHLFKPQEVLRKVAEWLKPGGVFYVMVPNIDSAGGRVFGSYWYALELPRHLYHYSPKSLRRMAASVGLEEVSMTTGRELFIEKSVHYILDDILKKVGITRAPLSKSQEPGSAWKVFRKMFRLTVLPVLTAVIGLGGDGESIHAVFRRPA